MPVPRITSRTPLRGFVLPAHRPSHSQSYSSLMAAVIQPRKHRHRTIFLVLFALFSVVTYLCIFQQTAVSTTFALKRGDVPTSQIGLALESLRHSHSRHTRPLSSHHPILKLGKNEELAAVSSFIASLPQNVIPSFVDPANPIDPHLVIDFDTRSPRATEEVKQMVEDVWTRNPVFLYSRLYSPKSREVKALLAGLHLKPAPTIIDVDIREDAEVLEPLVQRLTSVNELPVLLVGGKPVGDMATIRSRYESGDLQQMITDAGAVIDGAKKKHKKK